MTNWRIWIQRNVSRGIAAGQIRPETDGDLLATIIISTVEGAVIPRHAQRLQGAGAEPVGFQQPRIGHHDPNRAGLSGAIRG